jgi:hypothetical protein
LNQFVSILFVKIHVGLGLNEEVQPSMESSTKFSDVKGVDEAKSELEEIVHYLRDPKVKLFFKIIKGQPGARNSCLLRVRPLWVLCMQPFPIFL